MQELKARRTLGSDDFSAAWTRVRPGAHLPPCCCSELRPRRPSWASEVRPLVAAGRPRPHCDAPGRAAPCPPRGGRRGRQRDRGWPAWRRPLQRAPRCPGRPALGGQLPRLGLGGRGEAGVARRGRAPLSGSQGGWNDLGSHLFSPASSGHLRSLL